MQGITNDIIIILQYLLPGFITAWIFHALTSYPKQSQFERIIQALIFTTLVNVLVYSVAYITNIFSEIEIIWSNDFKLVIASIIAILFGFVMSYLANTDIAHKLLRKLNITRETSYASEWFSIFSDNITYVILHLDDGRRICGWPREWPTTPNTGHFFLNDAFWLNEKNEEIPLDTAIGILISSSEVKRVEFLNPIEES